MIISASRRTDIPAFYSEWFMHRLRKKFCLVPNPFNSKQISRISLNPKDVEAIVFWSKNPKPMLSNLDEIDRLGHVYYFHFTLNSYPSEFEPNIPNIVDRLDTFKALSKQIGVERVVWRYDPIVISNITDYDFHLEKFDRISSSLEGFTERVVVSYVDFYRKTKRNFSRLAEQGIKIDQDALEKKEFFDLLLNIKELALTRGLEIFSCAEVEEFSGISPGQCIDAALIKRLGKEVSTRKDPGQRKNCHCVKSRDIGVNDTCLHGCSYCYATTNKKLAIMRHSTHKVDTPMLLGKSIRLCEKRNRQLRLFDKQR